MTLSDMIVHLTGTVGSYGVSGRSQERAEALARFADGVSRQTLAKVGFMRPYTPPGRWNTEWEVHTANSMARLFEVSQGESDPGDLLNVKGLRLYNVPAALDAQKKDEVPCAHIFLFCKERVLEWDEKRQRVMRVLTYEEAARFILFWLAEKILQITRKNEFDKVQQLPDLFDRLNSVITAK